MWFWIIVLAIIVVVLVAAWRYDRRRKAPAGGIRRPRPDDAVNFAEADRDIRNLGNTGGTGNL
ncbi:MAG TPA: hypothetical protein VF426_00195 [Marmoricola sp.]